MIKNNPRDILNEFKWKKNLILENIEIWYVHRGAPDDTKIISGKNIVNLEKSFMQMDSAMIPYHRIFRIIYENKVVFERQKSRKNGKKDVFLD